MTKREGAIISAYTGKLCSSMEELQNYVEKILERPVFTHEFADKETVAEIKNKSEEDFMNLIKNQTN